MPLPADYDLYERNESGLADVSRLNNAARSVHSEPGEFAGCSQFESEGAQDALSLYGGSLGIFEGILATSLVWKSPNPAASEVRLPRFDLQLLPCRPELFVADTGLACFVIDF